MRLFRRRSAVEQLDDPRLEELRNADADYHGLCVDIQEPMLAIEQLRLEEMRAAVERLAAAIEALLSSESGPVAEPKR